MIFQIFCIGMVCLSGTSKIVFVDRVYMVVSLYLVIVSHVILYFVMVNHVIVYRKVESRAVVSG
jgi:hypothetical protein